jgi:DNA-directed RNA polymerase subunit RPC12/RpoP
MAIDTSGDWWKGLDFADLAEYIERITADGYPASRITQSKDICGEVTFRLYADADDGCAQRVCAKCGRTVFIGDSAENWDEAEPGRVRCPCGHDIHEIGVGFSMRTTHPDDVRWITIGVRCTRCGILGSPVDWEISYGPSGHLLLMA